MHTLGSHPTSPCPAATPRPVYNGGMDATEIFVDFASRPIDAVHNLPDLTPEQLNAHPGGHDNSIAWLLWHAGREVDMQLSQLNGSEQLWTAQGFKDRFALSHGDSLGYGHSSEEARSIVVNDQKLLVAYVTETLTSLIEYAKSGLDWDDVIDRNWTPAVTRGVRMISIVDDAAQHVGQAAYIAGMPEL